jgi:hypothetical protein
MQLPESIHQAASHPTSGGAPAVSRQEPGEVLAEGTERIIDGQLRGYFGGYWLKLYPVPEDSLLEKQRLIAALTRRLFNHVEHGLYVPGVRLEEARNAYVNEQDGERKRVKGGMLAGALFNRAADILTKLVELQALGVEIAASDPLMRRCGQHLQEALSLGTSVRHRTGEEGIDELWGEPFKAFAFPIKEFYHSRYIKLSMTMRCIDDISEGAAPPLEVCPGMMGVGAKVTALAEAAKDYAQSLRTDAQVFDSWATLAVAREHLEAHRAKLPKRGAPTERELGREAEQLAHEVGRLLFHIARARVPMPKSAAALGVRCRALSERSASLRHQEAERHAPRSGLMETARSLPSART